MSIFTHKHTYTLSISPFCTTHTDTPFGKDAHKCEKALLADFMVSLKAEIEQVLTSGYSVLVYSGQLDVIIGVAGTEQYLQTLEWPMQQDYLKVGRQIWYHNDDPNTDVSGYARQVGNFSQVTIRGAGHICPFDQPERSLDMITRFVEGKSFGAIPPQ
jgi:vitellogenic carboxypeptidase-like protein